jgi:hypothetical protein
MDIRTTYSSLGVYWSGGREFSDITTKIHATCYSS